MTTTPNDALNGLMNILDAALEHVPPVTRGLLAASARPLIAALQQPEPVVAPVAQEGG